MSPTLGEDTNREVPPSEKPVFYIVTVAKDIDSVETLWCDE